MWVDVTVEPVKLKLLGLPSNQKKKMAAHVPLPGARGWPGAMALWGWRPFKGNGLLHLYSMLTPASAETRWTPGWNTENTSPQKSQFQPLSQMCQFSLQIHTASGIWDMATDLSNIIFFFIAVRKRIRNHLRPCEMTAVGTCSPPELSQLSCSWHNSLQSRLDRT